MQNTRLQYGQRISTLSRLLQSSKEQGKERGWLGELGGALDDERGCGGKGGRGGG